MAAQSRLCVTPACSINLGGKKVNKNTVSTKLQWDWCHTVSVVTVLRAGQSTVQI